MTLDACRHGGMTQLGDAELAEQGVMALPGTRRPQAARRYVKRTERQRVTAAVKRRGFVEANETARGRHGHPYLRQLTPPELTVKAAETNLPPCAINCRKQLQYPGLFCQERLNLLPSPLNGAFDC
jgi:hypothetical protein